MCTHLSIYLFCMGHTTCVPKERERWNPTFWMYVHVPDFSFSALSEWLMSFVSYDYVKRHHLFSGNQDNFAFFPRSQTPESRLWPLDFSPLCIFKGFCKEIICFAQACIWTWLMSCVHDFCHRLNYWASCALNLIQNVRTSLLRLFKLVFCPRLFMQQHHLLLGIQVVGAQN